MEENNFGIKGYYDGEDIGWVAEHTTSRGSRTQLFRPDYTKRTVKKYSTLNRAEAQAKDIAFTNIDDIFYTDKDGKTVRRTIWGFEGALDFEQDKLTFKGEPFEEIKEEDVTQAGSVDGGRVDIVGTEPKGIDEDVYKQLFELKDWNEAPEDLVYEAREEMLNYLNEHTDYEWDIQEMYDNCVIAETEEDYIEVFVNVDVDNKKVSYEFEDRIYNTLDEVILIESTLSSLS